MASLDPATVLPNFLSVSDIVIEAPLMKFNGKDLPRGKHHNFNLFLSISN